ncbi:MAG: thioredoxin domain-containing protein, partial [Actinomycetota bacterium]
GDPRWLQEARATADAAIDLFFDSDQGGFFTTGEDQPRLVVRNKDLIDNAVPAANSVMALELQRLALITGEQRYASHAEPILQQLRDAASRSPLGFGHLLAAFDLFTSEPLEIVVVGEKPDPFLDVVWNTYLPARVIVRSATADTSVSPLLEGRDPGGTTTAYVCRRMVCKEPARDPGKLAEQLA